MVLVETSLVTRFDHEKHFDPGKHFDHEKHFSAKATQTRKHANRRKPDFLGNYDR